MSYYFHKTLISCLHMLLTCYTCCTKQFGPLLWSVWTLPYVREKETQLWIKHQNKNGNTIQRSRCDIIFAIQGNCFLLHSSTSFDEAFLPAVSPPSLSTTPGRLVLSICFQDTKGKRNRADLSFSFITFSNSVFITVLPLWCSLLPPLPRKSLHRDVYYFSILGSASL